MWELDHKESWALKNINSFELWYWRRLSRALWTCKEIQPVHPKGNQSWIFIGRTDGEAPILWSPDAKSWLIRKDPDAGKDWRQEEKVTTEDKMVWWHHQLKGHEFEQALGDGEGQVSLTCSSPWGCKESDTTEQLNKWDSFEDLKTLSLYLSGSQEKIIRLIEMYHWHWSRILK